MVIGIKAHPIQIGFFDALDNYFKGRHYKSIDAVAQISYLYFIISILIFSH